MKPNQLTINQLTTNNQALTMSSREIATLCDKRHDNVMADIRKMLDDLNLNCPDFSGEYKDTSGKSNPCFNLPKRECLILVSGYSTSLRAKIIDRWYELEQSQSPIPQTYPDALRAYADEVEKRMALEHQAKLNAPKVAHYDLVADRTNLVNASQVGAKVKLSAVRLNKILDGLGVYNKSVKRNKRTFNHWFIERGLGQMVQTDTGFDQALFTHKGEAWVVERLVSEGAICG